MFTKSKIALAATGIMFVYIVFNLANWETRNMLGWDETGYYIYLPAAFIYNDVGKLGFYPKIEQDYDLNSGAKLYGIYDEPTGNKLDKYTAGTAICEMPLFLLAHWYTLNDQKDFKKDGYSRPYMVSVVFSMITWVFAGLFFLRKFLLKYFSEAATAVTLLLIAFGTNLYFYTVCTLSMSHPFSFALFCFLLYATEQWYSNGRSINVILMGVVMGLIVITRPTNVVIAILPLCWKYKDGKVADKLLFYKKQLWPIIASVLAFLLVLMIQCSYWKYVTGKWVYFSYEGEGFDFSDPQIWRGLFSYQKGWFVYTPIAFIAIVGLIPLFRKYKRLTGIMLLYLAVNIYIVFSWRNWYYGGSFGCRALIESMAVVAIPLAMIIEWIFSSKKMLLNILTLTVFSFFIALNVFQSYQLINNKTEWARTNRAFYWRTLGKLDVTAEDRKLLDQ